MMKMKQTGGVLHGLWSMDNPFSEATPSDRRLKTNIEKLTDTLGDGGKLGLLDDILHKLQPTSYKLKGDKANTRFGFIADEVFKVLPQVTRTAETPDRKMGIIYQDLLAFLTTIMQELFVELSTATKGLASVENRIRKRISWRKSKRK